MARGGTHDDEPDDGRPPPPEDRPWRHPSEIGHDSLRLRHRRIRRTLGFAVAGTAAVAAGLWLTTGSTTTEAGVRSDGVDVVAADLRVDDLRADTTTSTSSSTTTTVASESWADEVARAARAGTATIRAERGSETLARALALGDGFLITSGRALGGHETVIVVWGEETLPAAVIGFDPVTDLSVLRIDRDRSTATAADADPVVAGDRVALVNPEGGSESRMVVEPVSASASSDGQSLLGMVELAGALGDLLPGTPAVDGTGAIVGIATSTADDAPAAIIPIELARELANEIIRDGEATHPWIGITARNRGDGDHGSLPAGAYVAAVVADGPAALGGVQADDVITTIGGTPVTTTAQMVAALRTHEPGDVVEILVERDGTEVSCAVELGSHLDDG